ncbi:MAG: head-tail adaptor [Gemmatimonadetes bacterium]|nr:head-tail adaptor [Gemmatimonadota bacterium]
MPINPGDLRQRVTLQSKVRTPDGGGGGAEAWVDGKTVWAEVMPLDGRELVQAMQVHPSVSHRVTIRYRAGVSSAMRALYAGRVLDIRSVVDRDERHEALQLLCVEGDA